MNYWGGELAEGLSEKLCAVVPTELQSPLRGEAKALEFW